MSSDEVGKGERGANEYGWCHQQLTMYGMWGNRSAAKKKKSTRTEIRRTPRSSDGFWRPLPSSYSLVVSKDTKTEE